MVARDLDIDYRAGGDASGEEDRGKFDLGSVSQRSDLRL